MEKWNEHWSMRYDSPREQQIEIINQIISAMDNEYRNIIVEAGTGVGKSAIATTVANMVNDTYILTRTKQLQEQYLEDFDYMLTEIKGRNNYLCKYQSTIDFIFHCDVCSKQVNKQKLCHDCEYISAREHAIRSENVLANYHYLYNASRYSDKWFTRELLILDEAHKFEEFIMSVVSVELSERYCKYNFEFDLFHHIKSQKLSQTQFERKYSNTAEWVDIIDRILDVCCKKESELLEEREQYLKREKAIITYEQELLDIGKKLQQINNKKTTFEELKKNISHDNWVVILPSLKEIKNNKINASIEFKPITVQRYTNPILSMGNTRIFFTATIGDVNKFCEWINIDPNETYHIKKKSDFPVKNRPIYREYIGNLSGFTNQVPNWKTEKGLEKILEICKKYPRNNGVIHTTSNYQTDWIVDNLQSEIPLLKIEANSKNNYKQKTREEILKYFQYSDEPNILIGAGIKDGVDLRDDECRFQILYKTPIPRFDAQVRKRNRKDKVWVNYQTIMDIIQSYGRGVRSETDYCDYYILDSQFEVLLDKWNYLFNDYFLEALQ